MVLCEAVCSSDLDSCITVVLRETVCSCAWIPVTLLCYVNLCAAVSIMLIYPTAQKRLFYGYSGFQIFVKLYSCDKLRINILPYDYKRGSLAYVML